MFNYKRDPCGPMYTCIGDGGNMEGLARWFIDDQPPAYCDDPYRFVPPQYQPSPSGKVGASGIAGCGGEGITLGWHTRRKGRLCPRTWLAAQGKEPAPHGWVDTAAPLAEPAGAVLNPAPLRAPLPCCCSR